jgi:hypothetical protein
VTNVSDLFPAGGGNNTIEMVASGALGNGDKVILQSDGTVKVIGTAAAATGSAVVFEGAAVYYGITATFDSAANKVVIAYRDAGNSNYGTAIVGTVSGTSISFGTAVVFSSENKTSRMSAVFDSNSNKVVIGHEGAWGYGYGIVGTVSGTSISFGSETSFVTGGQDHIRLTFDSSSNKVVACCQDIDTSNYGRAAVGTVSGTGISFGSLATFASGFTTFLYPTFDSSSNKVVIGYQNQGTTYGTAIVGTVSGTSISFGTAVVFESAGTSEIASTFDTNVNKVVIAYRDGGNSNYGTAIVGTVSGTSISFGSSAAFNTGLLQECSATFDTSANKAVIAYRDGGNSDYGTVVSCNISGTSISFDTPSVFEATDSRIPTATFDSNSNRVVIAYRDNGNSSYGTAVVHKSAATNLTATNLLGIAQATVADTATVEVETLGGLATNLSGLTIGSKYYVQTDGTITTSSAGQFLGRAITATTINMKDFT